MAAETTAADTSIRRPADRATLLTVITMTLAQIGIAVALYISLRSEIADTRGELRTEIASVEQSVSDTRAELRTEITNTRAELRADIAAVGERVTAVEGRIGRLEQRMARQEGLISGIVSVADIPLPLADTDTDPDPAAGE